MEDEDEVELEVEVEDDDDDDVEVEVEDGVEDEVVVLKSKCCKTLCKS